METDERFRQLQHNMGWLMTSLSQAPKGGYSATVHFGSYVSMVGFVTDLMRLCAIVQDDGDTCVSGPLDYRRISVTGLMEVAVQLMPVNECEFLDEARLLLAGNPEPESVSGDARYFLNPPVSLRPGMGPL